MRNAIVLAAGKGTRMKSELSKLMHPIIDRPMLGYILDALRAVHTERIVIVVGYQAQSIMDAYPECEFAMLICWRAGLGLGVVREGTVIFALLDGVLINLMTPAVRGCFDRLDHILKT